MLKVRTILHDGEEWTVPLNADLLRLTHVMFIRDDAGLPRVLGWYSRITGHVYAPVFSHPVPSHGLQWSCPVTHVEIHPDLDPDPVGDDEPDEQRRAA